MRFVEHRLIYCAGLPCWLPTQRADTQPAAFLSLQLQEAAVSVVFCLAQDRLSLLYYTSVAARG